MIFIKRFIQTCLLIPVFLILHINWSLHYTPNCEGNVNQDVLNQLNYLGQSMKQDGIDAQMQAYFPEGYFFTNVLYGLAWCDVLKSVNKQAPLFKRGVGEIEWSIGKLNSEEGKRIFNAQSPLPYGAFYNGWLAYLLGNYIETVGVQNAYPSLLLLFKNECAAIQLAISKTKSPYLESYRGMAWPADNILCLAALSLHDKLLPPQYKPTISAWLMRIKGKLDPKTGMIPHCFSLSESVGIEGVRGSSQSLMHCFLPSIDANFAKEQFALYRKNFIQYRLGLPCVREYPLDTEGSGDVDSGPIIWGVGPAASVVAIKAMSENQDFALHASIRNAIEAFGFSITWDDSKFYLGKQLPVADAFIGWCNAKNCLNLGQKMPFPSVFHLISLLVVVPFCWWVYKL